MLCSNDTERVRAVTKHTAPGTHCQQRLAAKFQFVGEFYLKEYATVRRGFFFVFSSSVFGFRLFD